MTFPCTSCGACCRRLNQVKNHGLPEKADGSCGHLVDNRCSIYSTRPDICRVDVMNARFSPLLNRSVASLNRLTAEKCNSFQEQDGLPVEFRVHLPKAENR